MQSLNRGQIRGRTEDAIHCLFAAKGMEWGNNHETTVGGEVTGRN